MPELHGISYFIVTILTLLGLKIFTVHPYLPFLNNNLNALTEIRNIT